MSITEEIKTDLDIIANHLMKATYYVQCLEYMSESLNSEIQNLTKTYIYINVSLNSLWYQSILELHKLLSTSQNDRYRYSSLINQLINNYQRIEWDHKLSKVELQGLLDEIGNNEKAIEKLKNIGITE